ncbi:MAG: hypothetical protein ACI8RD_013674 [Bacillariaceae sp.]|jgi:hypothetical protein
MHVLLLFQLGSLSGVFFCFFALRWCDMALPLPCQQIERQTERIIQVLYGIFIQSEKEESYFDLVLVLLDFFVFYVNYVVCWIKTLQVREH